MRNRRANTLFILMLAVLLIFNSCENASNGAEPLAQVSFGRHGSRNITSTNGIPGADDLYWYYTAEKVSGNLKTGEVAVQTAVSDSTGLDGKTVGPFSYGNWKFTLYGYAEDGRKNLVYSGVKEQNLNRSAVSVDVEVKYTPSSGDTGYLKINDVFMTPYTDLQVPAFTETSNVSVNKAGEEVENITLAMFDGKLSADRVELAGGVYELLFTLVEEGGVSYTDTKTILILPGRVTTVTGNLDETVNSGFGFKVTIAKETFFSTGKDYFVNSDGSLQDVFDAARKYAGDEDPVIHLNSSMTIPSTLIVAEVTDQKNKVVLDLNSSMLSVAGDVPVIRVIDPAFTLEVIGAGNIRGSIAKAVTSTVNAPEGCLTGEIVTE